MEGEGHRHHTRHGQVLPCDSREGEKEDEGDKKEMSFISEKRLKKSEYTEPYQPYVYCGLCRKCAYNGVRTRRIAEGREEGFKLYVRLVCPLNPEHNGNWYFHTMRPLRFRIIKTI